MTNRTINSLVGHSVRLCVIRELVKNRWKFSDDHLISAVEIIANMGGDDGDSAEDTAEP